MLTDAMHMKMSKPIEVFREIDTEKGPGYVQRTSLRRITKDFDLEFTDQFSALLSAAESVVVEM